MSNKKLWFRTNTPIFNIDFEIFKRNKMKFKYLLFILAFLLALGGCKEKTYVYEVEEVDLYSNASEKDKEKTVEQYLSILYANMFQKALSPNQLVNAKDVIISIGDKKVAYETVISKFMNDPEVKIPSGPEMRDDIDGFLIETYKRFFVRFPSEAEKAWFRNFIEAHPNITPEHIYFAFSTCNEYNYY